MNKIRNINKNKTVYSIDIFSEFRRKPREFLYLPEYGPSMNIRNETWRTGVKSTYNLFLVFFFLVQIINSCHFY